MYQSDQSAAYFHKQMPTLRSSRKYEGDGVSITQIFKRKYEATLEIPGGGRVQIKEPSSGEVWIFFGITPCGTKPVLQKKLDTLT